MAKTEEKPQAGQVTQLAPGIRRILAPNPGPMTFWGTNTYLVGEGAVAVIDPGPDNAAHLRAILSALAPGESISHILVTHAHLDHSPLARPLSDATGAPVVAFGTPFAGRSQVMTDLVAGGLSSGGEGVDLDFQPDICLADDQILDNGNWSIRAVWTPGHFSNHLCFAFQQALFTGDHVMGWASSLISPPDGDLTAFMASCDKLATRRDAIYLPGHGEPVTDPGARLAWLIAHRHEREAQILAALNVSAQDITSLTRRIYTETPPALLAAAERNVFAHLIDLHQRALVRATPRLDARASFDLIG